MLKKISVLALSAGLLFGCSDQSEVQKVPANLSGFYGPVTSELERQGIWYQQIDESTVEVKATDAQKVIKIAENISFMMLPPGRSAAYSSQIQWLLKRQLRVEGIKFETVCFDNKEFLVWEKEEAEKIETIAEKILRETKITAVESARCA